MSKVCPGAGIDGSELGEQIMVKRSICAVLLTIAVGIVTDVAAQTGPAQGPWAVIESNCFSCHNSTSKMGGLALDTKSPDRIAEDAQTWESVIRKLRGGLMPPVGAAKR